MARPPNIERPAHLHITLPESMKIKLDMLLFSKSAGRIPKGAHQRLILQLLERLFAEVEQRHNASTQ